MEKETLFIYVVIGLLTILLISLRYRYYPRVKMFKDEVEMRTFLYGRKGINFKVHLLYAGHRYKMPERLANKYSISRVDKWIVLYKKR